MKLQERVTPAFLLILSICVIHVRGQGIRVLFQCGFETADLCGMTQATNDQFDWTRKSGETPSGNTGPNAAADGNFYIFIETSGPRRNGDFATIRTPSLTYTGNICVRFKYHMYGQHSGYLKVYTTDKNNAAFDISGQKQGSNAAAYLDAAVDTSISSNQVNFEASRGGGVFSDIAIDTIRIVAGTCANPVTISPTTQRATTQQGTTQTPPVGPTGATCPNANALNFETAFITECNTVQATDDQFDWTLTNQPTTSTETGPNNAASGSYYIHIEASSPRQTGDTARLILQRPSISGTVCVRFSYNMYGHHTGKIEFYVSPGRTILWRLEGQQQTRTDRNWRDAVVEINNNAITQMGFIGTRGTDFTSDIALDNIRYTAGQCESTPAGSFYACDFELRSNTFVSRMCGITQATNDNLDWILKRGPTPSPVTGPSGANNGQYYLYAEASSPRVQGNTAIVYLPVSTTGTVCVSFAVSMYGWHMGTMELIRRRGNDITVAWNRSGQWDANWHDVSATVTQLQSGDRIGFRATRGTGYSGDIGLDKIRVRSNQC